ncbi:MAG TPA: family 78 glycoside hydrolase catalytic domain [Candidatus Aminicenantes bacterium]|nr:family 78 glycoside hydrolase catalytic domain [Candidatus Aminicenantes bacterium]HRY64552.1 family 78 glycoside hydrolase catalytic domain [Candidatus Aminicenantes bacterium]HRZ71465.1 family 78 glycoside hydrolase catalytic domain [Candidatus Aminicenantes bacterium]
MMSLPRRRDPRKLSNFGFAALAVIAVLTTVPAVSAAEIAGPSAPVSLRCEYLANPMGVDTARPRFFWVVDHAERGQVQSAYQIVVSTDPKSAAGDVWDSGKVASPRSAQIAFAGKALASGASYFWKVRAWDRDGRESPWSETARFDMGLLDRSDWQGVWIGARNQLRREFTLKGRVKRARAYIAGLGYYELRLNGRKAGNHVLDPAWTTYDKRVLYVAYDVTGLLRQGPNAVAVMLGNGWHKSRALLFQLNVEMEDGTTASVASDASWKAADGPIFEDSVYNGESYDARRETPGWDRPGFDDAGWPAAEAVKGPAGVLSAQLMPAIQVVDTIVPFKMTSPLPGAYVFDMGQNFSGWARLRVRGPRGTDVRLRFAELLFDNGTLNQDNLRTAQAEDHYILKGEGEEVWEPRFTYHGFRYVEVTGFPGTPTLESIRGRVVHSAVEPVGSFAASKDVLNGIQRLVTWGQKTNLHGIPTDCDQRDERMGWLGDAQITAEEAIMNFDMAAFYTNFMRDIRDVQDARGRLADTIPYIWGGENADPAWATAYPLICWYMYQYYGDTRVLEDHYDALKKYVEFLRSKAENGLVKFSSYGDWVAIEKCSNAIVSSFYYLYDVRILADAARVLGKTADAALYDKLAAEIRAAFNREYYNPKTGDYAEGTQTANALPLFLDIPTEKQWGTWGRLFDNIVYGRNAHLTTGIIGTKYVMEVLSRTGAADLAYDIACKTDFPSWGYMIQSGATTLWELWQNREGSAMNSHNHPMFGSVGSWFYKTLAGINLAPGATGFEKVLIQPQMVRDLTHASGSTMTVRGQVACAWSRTERTVRVEVTIPFGSEAEVVIPKLGIRNVKVSEGGRTVWAGGRYAAGAPGIAGAEDKDGAIRFKTGGGRYAFVLEGN